MSLISSFGAFAAAAALDATDPANFPPRDVQVPRTTLRNTLGYGGLGIAGIAAAATGVSLIRSLTSGGTMRLSLPLMMSFGAAALVGAAVWGGSRQIGPKTEHALAAGIPTREMAVNVEQRISGYTDVVECADGTFAVVRGAAPSYSSGGGSSSGGSSRPSNSGGGSRPSTNYPSSGGGSTSSGDDSGSSRNSTDNGNPSSDDF